MNMLPTPLRITDSEVALSPEGWAKVIELAEDYDDVAALATARLTDRGPPIPLEVVEAKLAGAHPLAAWRHYRNFSQAGLADFAGITRSMVGHIEGRRKKGSVATMACLARTLDVPIECLLEKL